MISIQTNVASLVAQQNLNTNTNFQNNTIEQLTSGYRINASGDDPAGLAVANQYRSDIAEVTQGVLNANDGLSTLQIADGGMNNISLMLDRLNTLATQSASGSFTGDRSTVNSEFQSLITEINRQAQAIGLDANGVLNTDVNVFIGGGKTQGTNANSTANGTVTLNLTGAAVDTKSLGLSGMVAIGGTSDIGTGSATHTVAQILANVNNTTQVAGTTNLLFSGPGFSDANSVKVAVNLSGVTDINSLVTAINSAISGAAGGASQADAAFGNAGIVASVHTDSNGGQELQFSSSTSAFQVSAGDVMANALLGNFVSTSQGAAISTTAVGANTTAGSIAAPTGVTVQVTGGGLASPVSLTLLSGSTTTAAALLDIANQVSNNTALEAAGITMTGTVGGAITFTSAQGQALNVAVTGDTANMLGFGSFVAGTGNAADYQTITGAANYNDAVATGTANLQISLNGGPSSAGGNGISVNLNQGTATAGEAVGSVAGTISDQTGLTLTMKIDGSATVRTVTFGTDVSIAAAATQINAASLAGTWGVTAGVDINGHLTITSATAGVSSDVDITGGTQTGLGLVAQHNYGTSRTETDVLAQINAQIAASNTLSGAGLQAVDNGGSIKLQSNNNTYFRVSASTSGALANIGFGVGSASTYTGATDGTSTQYSIASQGAANAAGTAGTSLLTYSNLVNGNNTQAITLSANNSSGALQTLTITLANDAAATRSGQTIDQAISYINQQLQQSDNSTLQQIVAVKENVSGTQEINFISGLNNFTLSVGSSGAGVQGGAAESVASTTLGTGNNVSVDTMANAVAAVNAIAGATTKLGAAQAGVGRGENQLNWAINLAQSQISNFSSAESGIRDANVAAEAANLTKAQVLQQASIAAMAQANSAPQAVLALLRT